MSATSRPALYLCPPPAARLSASDSAAGLRARQSRVRAHLRPVLRAASRAMLRLADFTQRLGI
jgi:hypothetical protein